MVHHDLMIQFFQSHRQRRIHIHWNQEPAEDKIHIQQKLRYISRPISSTT